MKSSVEAAENLVKEIRETRDESQEILLNLRNLNAESVDKEPERANRVSRDAQNNPEATLVDKAIAHAVYLQQQGKRDNAIEKWRAIAHIAEGSDNDLAVRAWLSIGYLVLVGGSKDCILAYDEAIRLKPDAAAYTSRGSSKVIFGRSDDAIADYNEAIRLEPDYAEAYASRGILKVMLKLYDDAIADYNEAIRLEPDAAAVTYTNRGILKTLLGRYNDAIVDYNEAIRLEPDSAGAYTNRGNAKTSLGRYDDAIVDHNEAIRLKPDADVYISRGDAKTSLGLKDEARKDFETGLELARNANNPNEVRRAEQSLRDLDDGA